jgi:putative endonuclease
MREVRTVTLEAKATSISSEMNSFGDLGDETAKSLPLCKAVSSPSFRYDESMYIVYVIQNSFTNEKYIGFTADLKKRLINHNAGGTKSTRKKLGTWKLIYAEAYRTESDARNRERRLKNHGSGKRELFKRLEGSLLDT